MSTSLLPIRRDQGPAPRAGAAVFTSLQREIDRLFEEFRGFHPFADLPASPKMDLGESDDAIEFTVELPGMEQKDVDISVADNLLTVRGEKRQEKEEKTKTYRLLERSYGAFSRTVELPQGVDPAKITATLANGVLKVTAPKPAKPEAKKIEVQAAA